MTFDEWWAANHESIGVEREAAEKIWNAAQEAVLMPLLAAGDDEPEEVVHAG